MKESKRHTIDITRRTKNILYRLSIDYNAFSIIWHGRGWYIDNITSGYKWGFTPKTWTQNVWLWHVMKDNGLDDKLLEGALHHVNIAGPQCQEFCTDFILK